MGQYKVPQNVESEDKLVGPLTMKQFIYAIIGLAWAFLIWRLFMGGGPVGILMMVVLITPISGFMFLLAFGRREEQSFENYLIALIRFSVMPRKRTWMKDDYKGEVIVDAPPPPKPSAPTKEDLDHVRSRLQQISLVVDTRGHAKPESIQLPDETNRAAQFSERVFTPDELTKTILPDEDMQVTDDVIAQAENAPQAQRVGEMLQNVEHDIREQARQQMTEQLNNPDVPAPQTAAQTSQATPDNAILKKVMDASHLSVAQVAQVASRGQLQAGESVQVR